jgi:hypothetical protein
MPTPPSALLQLEERVDEIQRELVAIAVSNDGVIDDRERSVINRLGDVRSELLIGDAMRIHAESILDTWEINGTPRSQRRIRELYRDIPARAFSVAN